MLEVIDATNTDAMNAIESWPQSSRQKQWNRTMRWGKRSPICGLHIQTQRSLLEQRSFAPFERSWANNFQK